MDKTTFDKIIDKRLQVVRTVMSSKNKEYSSQVDILHNFNKGSRMSNNPREKVLWGFALKHLISLTDIIDNIENKLPSESLLDEKITDLINYLILLESSIKEKIWKSK